MALAMPSMVLCRRRRRFSARRILAPSAATSLCEACKATSAASRTVCSAWNSKAHSCHDSEGLTGTGHRMMDALLAPSAATLLCEACKATFAASRMLCSA